MSTDDTSPLPDTITVEIEADTRNAQIGLLHAAAAARDLELTQLRRQLAHALPIVNAVLARHRHRANYPLADNHPGLASYETATNSWRIDDHNLDRAITRAAEAYTNATLTTHVPVEVQLARLWDDVDDSELRLSVDGSGDELAATVLLTARTAEIDTEHGPSWLTQTWQFTGLSVEEACSDALRWAEGLRAFAVHEGEAAS